jgi:hypothetical protein
MGLGTNQITTTIAGTSNGFIPELWSDEIAVKYKANLVLANLVDNMDQDGKYGDIIHVPSITRGATAQQFSAQGAEVAFSAPTVNEFQIVLDQWWVHGKQIPDIVAKQALPSMRRFIVDDMSYSLSLAVDDYLNDTTAALLRGATARAGMFIGSDGNTLWDPTANANAGNGAALNDEGIRRSMQRLDDLDVPGSERFWLVPPVEKRRLLAIPRYTEQAFTGESSGSNSIRNGYVGKLYGDEVYVSSNCSSFAATDTTTFYRQVVYAHKSAIILATQIKPRVQSQYKVEFLSDALVADVAFGAKVVRTENTTGLDRGLVIAVPTL